MSDLLIVLYTYFAITTRTAHIEDGHGYHQVPSDIDES